ncbi:protein translocase subunit SecD [Treponema sp.]|uniref:protein translocase subunit SecD n=1 Tax=Treponema sp. TaxID=166 RepID=UPI003F0A28F1
MSKKSRLFMIIAVLALCFAFLWPSISWYVRTPKEDKVLALSSLENIKDYSTFKASSEVKKLVEAVKENPDAPVPEDCQWLIEQAKKNYKASGEKAPSVILLKDALNSFESKPELASFIEGVYRKKILKIKSFYRNSVKLGLDLSGGMNVIVKADLDAVVAKQDGAVDAAVLKSEAMAQAIETLTSRIDRFGLSSPTIRQQGEDRIYIELPGSAEADQINSIIQGRGILNFRLVDRAATDSFNMYYYTNERESVFDARGNLIDPSIIPDDCDVFGYYETDEYGLDQRIGYLVVKKEIALDGKHIKSADVASEELTGRPTVVFSLDSEGTDIFGKFSAAHVGQELCIVSDNKIKSNAVLQSAILDGQVRITGNFGQREALNLRKVLQTAWLDVPLSVESQQVIGASLGEQAIRQGLWAVAAGLVSIMLFMLVWYHGSGINACISQVLNLYIMFSILSAFNLTITLPTVAGMILTIGMATDANVIIFERIKEERRLGKDRVSSIAIGFDNAKWAIMDSNITTFIAAMFMAQFGSGAVQGFAVSLAIGVVSTVFTALVVSKLIFDFQTEVLKIKNISIGWGIK